ncbi:hypothetical protein [Streptomyces sp. NPDC102264]|uniref:hypothetical protein n=1 Tax=Streptomyces sp. NPDC102264 TaxID=3366149 RepID=UPI0038270F1C
MAKPADQGADQTAEIERLRTEHATWRKLGRRNLERAHAENARLRADHAATVERIHVGIRRLAAHAVGFGDVLDDSDRGPWGKAVAADIAELRRLADEAQQQPTDEAQQQPTAGEQPDARRARYAAAIHRLNDNEGGGCLADLDEEHDRNALADAVMAVADEEQQNLRAELAEVRHVAQQNFRVVGVLRAELEAVASVDANRQARILEDVRRERDAQDALFGIQDMPDGTGITGDKERADGARHLCNAMFERGEGTFRDVFYEEVMEALAESDPVKLRAELIQATAVGVKWIEAIDRREGR